MRRRPKLQLAIKIQLLAVGATPLTIMPLHASMNGARGFINFKGASDGESADDS